MAEDPYFLLLNDNSSLANSYRHHDWKPLVEHYKSVRSAHFLNRCSFQNRLYHLRCFEPLFLHNLLGSSIDEKTLLLGSLPRSTMTFETEL